MGSTRVTIEVPDALHERLVEASRRADTSLDTTIVDLIERALADSAESSSPDRSNGEPEAFKRAQASLKERLRRGEDMSDLRRRVFDPEVAARERAKRPVLDPPLSQTIIEGREDRF